MTTERNSPVRDLKTGLRILTTQTPHVRGLCFPYFRNFARNAEIRFRFPITVLLGRNGTNKSSLLHALYGAPMGNTVAKFWFETHLDGIPRENEQGLKPSVIHSYVNADGEEVRCIKARAPRDKEDNFDPDYWETVKPTEPYGFPKEAKRIPPIRLHAVHLDFRGMLPAFDRYFYFPSKQHLSARSAHAKKKGSLRRDYRPQDYLRRRTKGLRDLIGTQGVKLADAELKVLSYILERTYTAGTLLQHDRFHGHEGWTLLFETSNVAQGYSEAFAGSGESAAAMLVHEIEKAPDGSLILLDEPETSLHPRAQQRMLEFLVDRAGRKKLQIVVASHSAEFGRLLPQAAIRVLHENTDGKIEINDRMTAAEALHEVGDIPSGRTILVEDERTRDIVLAELQLQSAQAAAEFKVVVRGGGVSRIYQDIRAHSSSERVDLFVVFDGDQKPSQAIPAEGELPWGLPALKSLISKLTKGNDTSGPDLDLSSSEEAVRYVRFLREQVHYLPARTPELVVWDDQVAAKMLTGTSSTAAVQNVDGKARIRDLAKKVPPFKETHVFESLLSSFLLGNSPARQELAETVRKIRGG